MSERKEAQIEELKGQCLEGFILNDEKTDLFIKTTTEEYILRAEAECCSESWFESIDATATYGKILEISEIKMDDIASETNEEYTQSYGLEIILTTGYIKIEMRNESNGYYGGFFTLYHG